jgi:hypothetical protein
MTWWQISIVVVVCTLSSAFMALVGASIANSVCEAAERAKWRIPSE